MQHRFLWLMKGLGGRRTARARMVRHHAPPFGRLVIDIGGQHDGLVQTMAKTAARTVGSSLGKEILRGVMGSLFGGGKRR